MASITSANAQVLISIPSLFPVPQALQAFAVEDIFDVDPIEPVETLMGVDGILSAGFVFVPVNQTFALQADSPSIVIFDTWWTAMQVVKDVYFASATILLPSLSKKWAMSQGVLTNYKPMPDAKKVLQPQRFRITWQSALPAVA
jgi:hypothetical protein